MTVAEQARFIQVINHLNSVGSYGKFVAIHADMMHRMHSSMGPIGRERFLPWHRRYLLMLEREMRAIDPQAFIPYWRWTADRALPPWMVTFRPTVSIPGVGVVTVSRAPQPPSELPTQSRIDGILALTTYSAFTSDLENRPHNRVHMWVNGTMSSIPTAPADPLFWMHHAMIDRIWASWQSRPANLGKNPTLSGMDAILDPWPESEQAVRSIKKLGYRYGPG